VLLLAAFMNLAYPHTEMAGADERRGGPESDPEVAASELAASGKPANH